MLKFRFAALKAAKEAGRIHLKYFRKKFNIKYKGRRNLVTTADISAEKQILKILKSKFPAHNFLLEESDKIDKGSEFTWVVDPLDGTTSFAHGYPFFCVSIGLLKNKEPILGVVYAPILKELFIAEKGKGAFLNNKRIQVSKTKKLRYSLLATGFPYVGEKILKKNVKNVGNFIGKVHGIRRDGAAALDLCYLASGRFDGFWEYSLFPWDLAAGVLIVKEAGGKVTGFNNKPITIFDRNVVASNGLIHKQMLKILKR